MRPDILAQQTAEKARPVLANTSRLQHPCTVQVFTSAHIQGLILELEHLIYIPQQEGRLMTSGILQLLFLPYLLQCVHQSDIISHFVNPYLILLFYVI